MHYSGRRRRLLRRATAERRRALAGLGAVGPAEHGQPTNPIFFLISFCFQSWESTSVHLQELGADGESRVLLENGRSNFGLAWTGPALDRLLLVSDADGGLWNVHELDHLGGLA